MISWVTAIERKSFPLKLSIYDFIVNLSLKNLTVASNWWTQRVFDNSAAIHYTTCFGWVGGHQLKRRRDIQNVCYGHRLMITSCSEWHLFRDRISNFGSEKQRGRGYTFLYCTPLQKVDVPDFWIGGVLQNISSTTRKSKIDFFKFSDRPIFWTFQFSRTPPHKTLHEFRRHIGPWKTDAWKKCNSKKYCNSS